MSGKASAAPWVSSMSPAHPLWDSTESTEMPINLVLRLSNSGLALENAPSSVVQTGVKSFGWEKRIPQLSPSHSWKLMLPSVVSAVKSGAVSPIARAMPSPFSVLLLCSRSDLGSKETLPARPPKVDRFGRLFGGLVRQAPRSQAVSWALCDC